MKIVIETGHTVDELFVSSYWDDTCWDFPIEDFVSGAIEPRDDIVYWLIDGRIFETLIKRD